MHGWGCNREVWRPLLVLLRPWANITLVDIPGCVPCSSSATVPDLSELLAAILDCCPRRAVYVGWSLGGVLGAALTGQHPERVTALVTLCSNPLFVATDDWPGMDAAAFRAFAAGMEQQPVAALKRFDSLQVTGARYPRQLLRQLQALGRQPASDTLLAGLEWLEMLDMREALLKLKPRQMHLLAAEDALVPAAVACLLESHLAIIPGARVRVLPSCSHLAPLDAPELLAQELLTFLEGSGTSFERPGTEPELEKKAVAASFSRAATQYDSVAQLQRNVGERLLTYLNDWPGEPTRVLDLGCGTGHFCPSLTARYPRAQYLGLDLASGMVEYARTRCAGDCDWLVADAESLPLASESIDLVFSSLAVQWCLRPEHLFAELARILRPGGKCVFTSLAPDTLFELRSAWAAVDSHQHVNTFLPTADLLAAVEHIPSTQLTVEQQVFGMAYTRVRDLLDELKTLGAHNMNRSRPAGLTSRRALQGMLQAYEARRCEGLLPATYDVIFGVLEKR